LKQGDAVWWHDSASDPPQPTRTGLVIRVEPAQVWIKRTDDEPSQKHEPRLVHHAEDTPPVKGCSACLAK
jgi:hypothetical protein